MDHTPNKPRIHATICGAPKIAAIPTIAPITHPHEIFPTEAAMARAMTSNAAIGVAIVRAKLKREVAPVLNGEACAKVGSPLSYSDAVTAFAQASPSTRAPPPS